MKWILADHPQIQGIVNGSIACDPERRAAIIARVEGREPVNSAPQFSSGRYIERVGTALSRLIEGLLKIKSGHGCGCHKLADQMDQWGIAGCERNRELIVSQLLANRDMLADAVASAGKAHSAIGWALHTRLAEPVLQAGANWLLTSAIEEVRKQPKPVMRHNLGLGSAFQSTGSPVRFVTSAVLQHDIKQLLGKLPSDITAIAGVARSGLSVATMLAMYLQLPMMTIRQTLNDVIDTGNGWRLGGSKHIDPKQGRILVVDDTVMTGNSLKAIRPLVEKQIGNAVFAAVYVNPMALHKPDIWAVDLGWPHLLEWNLFNSVLSPSTAMDFDGILCHDCRPEQDDDGPRYRDFLQNAAPLYVPRRVPVPLIVTARLERYRAETEEWLRRHRITWKQLIMHPARSLHERERDDIAAYKARHFSAWASTHKAAPGPILFVESHDAQARRIAQLSQRMTVCPASAGVY